VRSVIDRGGVSALCVGDKPALEARLVAFADLEADAERDVLLDAESSS
jgi:hypothetical protein